MRPALASLAQLLVQHALPARWDEQMQPAEAEQAAAQAAAEKRRQQEAQRQQQEAQQQAAEAQRQAEERERALQALLAEEEREDAAKVRAWWVY